MATETSKTAAKSLSDKDIATFTRRPGPAGGEAGTDVDSHSDSDAPAASTDHDTAPATATDSDA